MAKQDQRVLVSPPEQTDIQNGLQDFAATIQQNFEDLFTQLGSNPVFGVAPSDTDGSVGDIRLISDNGTDYLYAKFPDGWKRFVPA